MKTVSRLIQAFAPAHYKLSLTLNRTERTFSGVVTITGITAQDNLLRLHAKDLEIESATIDGHKASFRTEENDELVLENDDIQAGEHIVVVGFSGKITDGMHGLYPCYFEHDGIKKELLATQFESHHAREVFPCVDEPEAKATFDVILTTEKGVTVLGNMPVKSQVEEADKLVTSFDRTPRMSSYLLAWVVGELHKKSGQTKTGVEVNVWATPAQSSESLDFALDTAIKATEFFNEYFGTDYPLPKCDHVALPDFTSGAMENWGLITYREICLLVEPGQTSISTKRYVAMVISHELSHQWFGNLVTMKWWNNLWLNESFANLMEYIAVDALFPEWNIWLDYSSQEVIMALRRDAIDGVQPVQLEVNHPDEITTLFDGAIVYAKGGRLLRMLQHYIGHDAFQAGLKAYFKSYAYQNTEGDDLWNELAKASGQDIAAFMNTWISQAGYPVVHVESNKLRQEQFFVGNHQSSSQTWPIPLEASVPITPNLMQTSEITTLVQPGERLNVGDTAHFITHYQDDHLASLLEQLKAGALKPIDRLQLLHEQVMLARGSITSNAALIPLISTYSHETIDSVWDVISLAIGELKKFVETDEAAEKKLRKLSAVTAHEQFKRLGWEPIADEPETDTQLRGTILGLTLYGEDPVAIKKACELFDTTSLDELDPELRSLIISTKVRYEGSQDLVNTLLDSYRKTHSPELKSDLSSGITSSRDHDIIAQLLDAIKDPETVRPQDAFRWYVYLIRTRDSRDQAWQWTKDNWDWIEKTFSGDKSYDDFPRYAASGLMTREQLEDYKAFFEPKKSILALKRVIELGINEIEARVELIEKDGSHVIKALLKD
ncbi:MAG TPA: M1 family metallopeptidase [Candidatus Saccharimonadales bacterium]